MERLGVLDSSFWAIEDRHVAVHIGGVAIFAGPPPAYGELLERYARAVEAHPRYRQKLRRPVLPLSRAVWVDDRGFDLSGHVRRLVLPRPLDGREFDELVAEIMTRRLDPDRALWEAVIVEGLPDRRWAVITKVHHSMVDGRAMMDLFVDLLDRAPKPRRGSAPVHGVARPRPRRPVMARAVPSIVRGTAAAALQPVRTTRSLLADARGALDLAAALRPTAATSLVGSLHTPRTYRTARFPLASIRTAQEQLGGTVNDVALTLATRAFRRLLLARGETVGPRSVRCLVPVSTRDTARSPEAGNHVSAMLVDLPVDYGDPAACFGALTARIRRLKGSGEAAAGELGVALASRLPVPLVTGFLRTTRRVPQHVVTTVVTNVPGPDRPLTLLRRPLLELYPYVPLAEHIRIGVAVTSYGGQLTFGVTCDRDSVPDAEVFLAGLTEGLAELVGATTDARRA